jgi:ubiquinone/menaquinone biosynthesis C-methylase UbiE
MVQLSPGDVVLDPCAGIGTIAMEVPPGVVGIGGDLILNDSPLRTVAAEYTRQMQQHNACCRSSLLAWDAALLPLRSSCVDAILTDLPFGQQCLSSKKLCELLPLLFGEFGRVLRPNTGRMLLLCGSFAPILDTLEELNSLQSEGMVWNLSAESVSPVNIGGFAAWIIKVQRGPAGSVLVSNHTEQARKLVRNRERVEKLRKIEPQRATTNNGRSKYRRIQS